MRIERTKNAVKNIIFGILLKIFQIIIPFLMRTALIYTLGVEYLGLNSLFTSILQVLNLAELGVGSAMVFSMYKPIAEDDSKTICALMKLYKKYYRIIGWVVLIAGIIVCPFVPYLIKGDLPGELNVYILYIINLLATVFSYWLFAYKNSLLQAFQRIDTISKVTMFVNTIQYTLQFIVLFLLKNYYCYIILTLLGQIMVNIITSIVVSKMYPEYKAIGNLEKSKIKGINRRVKDLFTSRIGGLIVNSADSIVISAFLGLTMLAVYQNYYYILTAIITLVAVIFSSCTAGIGNSIITETEEKNYKDLKKITFIVGWIAGICTCCFLNLFQPFMTWWVGSDLLLDYSCVICLCIYFWVYEINTLLITYKDAAGIWHKDRFRPLITAITNLTLNLILVRYIGIYGVILSTVISTVVVGLPWLLYNLFTEIFKRDIKEYVCNLIKYVFATIVMSLFTYVCCNLIQGYSILIILVKAIICVVISTIIWIVVFKRTDEMKETIKLVNKILKRDS